MSDRRDVVRLRPAQLEQAIEVLTRAFQDDPMWSCLFPDAAKRARYMRSIWNGLLRFSHAYGEAYTTEGVEGVAGWIAPGNARMTLWKMARTGMALPRAVMRLDKEDRRRFLSAVKPLDRLHKRRMPEPHWYLWALGVAPEFQGQGIGGRLIQPVLEKADQGGRPCYLETQSERNVAFYQRRGFEVIGECLVGGCDVPTWMMARAATRVGETRPGQPS
jgi:ribosomal protein S18 acetylase RimI-like enzyme